MATLTMPFVFTGGTYAVAAQVNSDFTILYGWVNGGSAIWADASRAFTAVPSGPSADPASSNQLARKFYVDQKLTSQGGTPGAHNNGIVKWGNASIATATNGLANVTYPTAFPSACQGAVVSAVFGGNISVQVNDTGAASFLSVYAFVPSTGAAYHGSLNLSYVAFGF